MSINHTNDAMNPEHIQPISIKTGIITVSSTRDTGTDSSGKIIATCLDHASYPVDYYVIVPDRIEAIREAVDNGLGQCDCLILTRIGSAVTSFSDIVKPN